MEKMFKYFFLIPLLFVSLIFKGQNQDKLMDFLTVEEGLSHNEVTSFIQDEDGFIWIGTRGGLNRYDGYEFKVFNQVPGDSNSLVNPSIETLFKDSKGNIWIGTKSGGISKYNPETNKFTNISNNYSQINIKMPARRVLSFYEDKEERIWIGTWNRGLYIYDVINNSVTNHLGKARVNSIIGTSENNIWIGTDSDGLFEYIASSDTFIQRVKTTEIFSCRDLLYDESRNVIWIATGDHIGAGEDQYGLIKFDLRNNKYFNYRIEDYNNEEQNMPRSYYTIHKDKSENIWIGTWGTGTYIFNPEQETFTRYFVYPEGGQQKNKDYDAVLDIFEDREKNLWMGTNGGGVVLLTPKIGFNTVGFNPEPNKGLINTRIMSVLEDHSGKLWIGTIGDGLIWSPDRLNFYQVENPTLVNKSRFFVIKYIYEDNSGNIWVGTNLGTFTIEFTGEIPQMVRARRKHNNIDFTSTAVSFLDAENMLFIGTLTKGLYLLDKDTYKTLKHIYIDDNPTGSMTSNRISYLYQDSKERIWLGTYNGVHIFDTKDSVVHLVHKYYDINGSFTGNIITSVAEDKKGNIWFGTPNGLNKLTETGDNKFKVTYYTQKDNDLASNFIKGIEGDSRGNIWFSTNAGITKYVAKEDRFVNFDEKDGVQGKNYTEASVCKGVKGELFFGGTHGLTYFKPDEITEQTKAFKPVFTGLSVLNEPVEIGKKYGTRAILEKSISKTGEIVLPFDQNKLEIHFSALDYESKGRNNYKFFLENQDQDWIQLGNRRFVIFNNLKPGDYILHVKSSNSHNYWNETPAQLKIKVKPPFWRTWYALVFYILMAVSIVTIIRLNAIKQVRLTNSLEMVKMQNEQVQKMNEMKLRFFTNISHEFRTPLTLILAPLKEIIRQSEKYGLSEELKSKIRLVQNNSARLMKLVNQLMDFRKLESGNMKLYASLTNVDDFVSEVCHTFYELAQINHINFRFKSTLKTKEIWIDREKMEIVLNNLISNAFKYTNNKGKIEVSLFEEEDEVLLCISDNGRGIPPTEIKHIFERFYRIDRNDENNGSGIGLNLSKKFVELHKGTISVTSEPNMHTEFIVTLPKGKEHLNPDEIVEVKKAHATFVKEEHIFSVIPSKSITKAQSDVRILVVEDDTQVMNYLLELLESGYHVITASNGLEGIEKVKEEIPDLIISDVMMPKMDGFEFCKSLREKEATSTIPFIFLTAKSDEQFRLLGEQVGANDFISKPFDPELLKEKVKNILERHRKMKRQYSKSVLLGPSDIEIKSGEEVFIEKVISIIEKNLQNHNFSSEYLASELNRSYSSLYRKLKRLTGYSAAEFIRSIRIKRAAQLLSDKERTITEIAYEVGFNDVKHFRSVFQKQYSCSPSEYREKLDT